MFKKLLLGAVALIALTGAARADIVLGLTGPIQGNTVGPQSASNPCIIAGTNCTASPLGYNQFSPNNSSDYDRWSTAAGGSGGQNVPDGQQGVPYNALSLVLATGGISFDIAIDVNTTAAHGETLQLFQIWDTTTNTLLAHYTGPTNIATNLANNGNGWADFLLSGFSFAGSGVLPTDGIAFHAVWSGATDGAESFFLVNGSGGTIINPQCPDNSCTQAVPGPIAGAGLPGLITACAFMWGFARRRRSKLA